MHPSPQKLISIVLVIGVLVGGLSLYNRSSQPGSPALQPELVDPTAQEAEGNHGNYSGRWRKARTTLSEAQREELKQLEAIGYVSGSIEAEGLGGVTTYDKASAYEGYNFYTSGDRPGAVLMSMDGKIIHQWELSFAEAFPNATRDDRQSNGAHHWRRAKLLKNGDVIVVFGGLGIMRVDKDSKLLWAAYNRAHHDAQIMPNGDIYTLTRRSHMVPRVNKRSPIAEDYISLLDSNGTEKASWSVLEAVEKWQGPRIWNPKAQKKGDIFHTNAILLLERDYTDQHPAFTKGRVLTSMRQLDALALIDLQTNEVVWTHTGKFRGQHDPRMLADGKLLFFDNNGRKKSSAVIELNLQTGRPAWRFAGTEEQPFHTRFCGTAARLPNGNTLVTESDNGRAFELTPDKKIVWEFQNPARAGDNMEFIAALFEVERHDMALDLSWLPVTP
jgi:hypothetical protein